MLLTGRTIPAHRHGGGKHVLRSKRSQIQLLFFGGDCLAGRVARKIASSQEASPEGHECGRWYQAIARIIFVVEATGTAETARMEGCHRRPVGCRTDCEPFGLGVLYGPGGGYGIH